MTYATASDESVGTEGAEVGCAWVSSMKRGFASLAGSAAESVRWVSTKPMRASCTMKERRSAGKPGSNGT